MMKTFIIKKTGLLVLVAAVLLTPVLSSCGTMAGQQSSEMMVKSQKDGVEFEIVDANGNLVASGKTPQAITLKSGNGFAPAKYTLKYKKASGDSTQSLKAGGNTSAVIKDAIFLVVIGSGLLFYVIDAATGALYKLPESVTLQDVAYHPGEVTILSIEDIKPEMRQYLIPVTQ